MSTHDDAALAHPGNPPLPNPSSSHIDKGVDQGKLYLAVAQIVAARITSNPEYMDNDVVTLIDKVSKALIKSYRESFDK